MDHASRFLFAALAIIGLALLFKPDTAEGQTMPLQVLAMPDGGALIAPPRQFAAVYAGCPGMPMGGQQTAVIQNYKTWNGSTQTTNIRVGPCTGLKAFPATSANGIQLEPGQAVDWRVSEFGPCVVSDSTTDAGVYVGVVCGGGAAR